MKAQGWGTQCIVWEWTHPSTDEGGRPQGSGQGSLDLSAALKSQVRWSQEGAMV